MFIFYLFIYFYNLRGIFIVMNNFYFETLITICSEYFKALQEDNYKKNFIMDACINVRKTQTDIT